jgi:DNA-directed RNA polymerase II subunit RPB2
MTSLSQEGLGFLEKYFKETEFALTRHHLDSYEHAVFEEIPSIIHSANPLTFMKEPLDSEGTVFAYKIEVFVGGAAETPAGLALSVAPPVVTVDGGNTVRRMFPNEARLRNLTYAAQLSADLLIRVTFTRPREGAPGMYDTEIKEAPVIRGFPLCKLPVLLRSRLCATGVADGARLEEMGECRNDYGGYFIVDGAEKVLITREEQAFNSLFVDRKFDAASGKRNGYASVVSLNPATKQTRRVALYQIPTGEIRVGIPMVRGEFPVFILFRALGLESDEEIVRLVFPERGNPLEAELLASIHDAYPIFNRFTATQFIKTLTKGFTEAHVLDILQNLMLPHVPNEPMARAQYLAEMIREMLLVQAGKKPVTNRDDMRTQRFLPTGILLRELFNGAWKAWRAAVTYTVDVAYRSNPQLYQGDAVFDLFGDANVVKMLQPEVLDKAIQRGFHGRWGTGPENEKSGVLQPLARISYADALSHTRRVVSDFPSGMKTTGPRKLDTSQYGYFCTSETPQGAHIGLTKNMSMMTQYSFGAAAGPVLGWLKAKGGVVPVADTTAAMRASAAIVQINGGTVGFTAAPRELVQVLRLLKWNGFLSPTASISFNTTDKMVRIFLDEGRPVRPLWHLAGEGAAFLDRLPVLKTMRWRDLVFGTAAASAGVTLRSVRFLDPLADNPRATFADYTALLTPTAGHIEYCDPMEMNEALIAIWGSAEELTPDHTHCEIHPSTVTGFMASMIPYSNHNQAPRNQLSNSQSKQGIGYVATNIKNRFDSNMHMLCYGESPLSRTFYYDMIGNGEMPYGFNCIIAATSESGYNQDDGLIINRDSVARGMFHSLGFRTYDCAEEEDSRTKTHSHVANPGAVPAWTALRPGMDYSKLDERGIIREGEIVDDTTVLVGRYMVVPATNDVKDVSVAPALHTQGRVDSVVVLHQGDGRLLVKVRVIALRVPVLGDKFSSRHGQKGTIGMFVSAADMPRTADGIVPDVMVNPGGLISRMTVAQLLEMVAGRAGAALAAKFNATTFCNNGDFVAQLGNILQEVGAHREGDNVLYSGITGEQVRTDIFMCPLYFMRLKHLTEDKVNARGEGRREVRTHQPTGGRANEGGLRIGEMERDSLCAHGVSTFLQESMMKRGDETRFWICNGCGRIPIYNEQEGLFLCSTCDGPLTFNGVTPETLTLQLPTRQSRVTFSQVAMPYTMKVLDQEMSGIGGFGMRLVTEGRVTHLREDDWEWPEVAVEFKAGERGVGEAEAVNPEARAATEAAIAAAAEKPKRKGKAVVAGATPSGAVETAEATVAEVVAAVGPIVPAAAGRGGGGAALGGVGYVPPTAGAGVGAGAGGSIRFSETSFGKELYLSTFASTPFTIRNSQIAGPGGVAYPDFAPDEPARHIWPTVEHYYQSMKFPDDPVWQEEIRRARTPAIAKRMGLDRAHPVRADWEAVKVAYMRAALEAKFRQNPIALAYLIQSGTKKIEYTTKADTFWGLGTRGNGENRLGQLLEETRQKLKDMPVAEMLLPSLGKYVNPANAADPSFVEHTLAGMAIPSLDEVEGDEAMYNQPANMVSAAAEVVAEATGGQVQLAAGAAGGGEGGGGGGAAATETVAVPPAPEPTADQPIRQQGGGGGANGVYLFVNPVMREFADQKARRARAGGSGRAFTWAGAAGQMGGGGGGDVGTLSAGEGAAGAEVVVMKEGQ